MLSKAAFNALLKTLEEPPEHVKFILATTEAEKVLQTILSRCQRYDFRNIPTREIAGHLKAVCKKEGIKAEDDALLLVAKAGAGSMRDSLSLLDRLLSIGEKTLTVEQIEQLLGLPKAMLMFELAQSIGEGDVKGVLGKSSDMITRGLSSDTMIASLVDHLRNLLILRTCGGDSELVEVPGVPLKDLVAQAGRFDAVNLTQDITILEELRRHMRQSQSGRALLDATLVRLTLAEQFTPVDVLLARVGGTAAPAGGDQKKNFVSPAVVAPVTAPVVQAFSSPPVVQAFSSPPVGQTFLSAPSAPPVVAAPVPIAKSADAAPVVAPPPALDFEDEDDDLPRPGKVWDNSGPSLKELLAQQHAAQAPAPPPEPAPDPAFTNVEPVNDLPTIWRTLLDMMLAHGPGLHPLLSSGDFIGVEDGNAIIRFSKQNETFTKLLDRNGKKELVRDGFAKILRKPVGERFVGDASAPDPEPAAAPTPAARPTSRAAAPPPPEPAAPAGPPAIRITEEIVEELKRDALLASVMDKLTAQPVKIE
jgi:DNA polymerase-3 subunit gamma/tau